LPGNTLVETKILPSHLIVTATGPAYFVADCGELLAWTGWALLTNARNISCYCRPLITSFVVDPVHSHSTLLKYKGYCNINFELTQLGTSGESVPGLLNLSRDILGENILILGFPIPRRPEGYTGLELSFNSLLCYLQTPKAEISALDVFIKGPKGTLKLIEHTDNVFLWRFDYSLAGCSSYCANHQSKFQVDKSHGPLDHHVLEAGRHIISKCADDAAPAEGVYKPVLN
jgi:hypothetical protein